MKIFEEKEMLEKSKALCTVLDRTLVLHNIQKEFYHQKEKEDQFITITRHSDTNKLFVCINIDKLEEILSKKRQ